MLVIPHKWARLRESALLDECGPEILRCAQDDKTALCHPERSEGSIAHLWVITSFLYVSIHWHRPLLLIARPRSLALTTQPILPAVGLNG